MNSQENPLWDMFSVQNWWFIFSFRPLTLMQKKIRLSTFLQHPWCASWAIFFWGAPSPPSTSSPIAAERWPLSTPGRLAVRTGHLKHSSPLVYCAYQRLQSKIVEHCSECLACNGYPSVPSHTLIWHLTLHVDSSAPIIHQESPIRITGIFPRRILLWWTQWSFVNCC